MYRRAVEGILGEGRYQLLNRFRLDLTLHNPGHQVSDVGSLENCFLWNCKYIQVDLFMTAFHPWSLYCIYKNC